MMNPDITDPTWLAAREMQWEKYCSDVSDEISKQELEFIRPIFFEAQFDYGNVEKYGKYAEDFGKAFVLCPVQTVERWEKWFSEYLPEWLGEEFSSKLDNLLVRFGFYGLHRNWTLETAVELFRFCFGSNIASKPFVFLQYELPKHPLLNGAGCWNFYRRWVLDMVNWLTGNGADEPGEYSSYLLDAWISVLSFQHPILFRYELNMDTLGDQDNLQRLFVLCGENYSFEKQLASSNLDRFKIDKLLESDKGRRVEFVKEFRVAMDVSELPEEMRALWKRSHDKDFVLASHQELFVMEKKEKVRKHELVKWMDTRINAL